eukprot:CAMPEP_0119035672 /NCGR_PEP_ID=MMETSP1177-20130426/2852_1 /TAXON_ID=2985 /ORGANISM="Ochromonas sp, Strain CCMP1899" /LENGTH=271 /DNA_ID=CAMNT_0006994297 /DNA_START=86 /DNA_END=898 /DNA_ORIENTATION=-
MGDSGSSSIGEELLQLLNANESGLSDEQISNHFGPRYGELVPILNELLSMNRLQLFTQGGVLIYRIVQEETAAKFDGLGPEQLLVYQVCERSGNRGIWTRDIKVSTNIPQHTLTKTLKILEQRNLIKSVRSVVSKSKKLYMLYDIVPAKEITGGPWYTEQEFDHEFVEELCNFVVQFVNSKGMIDLVAINARVRISGISKVELSLEELELVLQTLVYDGRLEEVRTSVLSYTGHTGTGQTMYKVSKSINPPNFLTETPCGVCPVSSQCCEG